MSDPWGDRALREHLRPLAHEPFFAPEDGHVENDKMAEEYGGSGDGSGEPETVVIEPEVEEPEPETETQPEEEYVPDENSLAGKVLTVLHAFPKERLQYREIAATLGIESKQVGSAIVYLQRRRIHAFCENGVCWYDPDQPLDKKAIERATWYQEYKNPSKSKRKTVRPAGTPRSLLTPNLLKELPVHDRAVILYEALAKHLHFGQNSVTVPSQRALDETGHADLFPTKAVITVTLRYLSLLGSVVQAGPTKVIGTHPDEVEPELRDEAEATIMSSFASLGPDAYSRNKEPKPKTAPEPTPEPVERTFGGGLERVVEVDVTDLVRELISADDPIDQVDDDRLANALANGMWTRYEWAITEVGKLNEQLAALREAVRARDEEIQRLRGYVAQHLANRDIKDIAREILTPNTDRG